MWDMTKNTFCPKFTPKLFIFGISIFEIIVFLLCAIFGKINRKGPLLQLTDGTLYDAGGKDPYALRYQY
jgi:hypothetical protein